ncbi:GAS multi-domain protein [Pyrenophora tritici-repentis]|uniref:APG6 multi-domain protein n=1 Tax=Pyrenophora tritici-repentis TaxID=45151 RepID=A0A922SWK0_9PLEO|nr:APG6 multi-domain protein [Pyrenophora tritici-repentis]KAI1533133.1 GAS multi-domain protein [Pyrenophora tritici-repentis]KAI1543162.1 GAS multi-domain protein [Pyrenophora tritici-repentis]KAI1565730.1 GAS multi-domain protein [Pyrenophora tritici-repentis]KAI1571005.1 GAS multi-domain protein [Pyrenophora tritici-repentis]
MAGHRALTYDEQTVRLRDSTSRPSQVPGLPSGASVSTQLPPQRSQQLPGPDLFAALLFDRRRAYQSFANASSGLRPISTSTPTGPNPTIRPAPAPHLTSGIHVHSTMREIPRHEETFMLGFKDRSKTPAASRKRERPAETKMTTVKQQKRRPPSPLRTSPRLAKRQKTEVNGKKKVVDKAGTVAKGGKRTLSDVIIISSDNEDEDEAPIMPFIDPDIDEDVELIIADIESTPPVTEKLPGRMPLKNISQPDTSVLSSVPPEKQPSNALAQDNLQEELARLKSEHAEEVDRLRQELAAAKTEATRIQQLHDTAIKDQELEHVRAINLAEGRYAATEHVLEVGRQEFRQLKRENESLIIQINNLEAECDVLAKEFIDEKAQRTKEKKEHEQALEELMNGKDAEIERVTNDLLAENQRLGAENERLKAEAATVAAVASQSQSQLSPSFLLPLTITPLPSQTPSQTPLSPAFPSPLFTTPPSSPAPSSIFSLAPSSVFSIPPSTADSHKDDNIRKVYARTKLRFDSLHSVAINMVHCTRNMDLSAWGEFGKCVGKMKEVLSEGKKEGVR